MAKRKEQKMETRIVVHFDSLSEFPVNKNTEITCGRITIESQRSFRLVTELNVNKDTILICHTKLLSSMEESKMLLEEYGYDFEQFKWR